MRRTSATTLDEVIEARNRAAQGGVNSADEAQLRVALDKLLALGEAYPDLKASANFQELQSELADVEDKLAAARRALNAAVSRYNAAIETFPAVLFAGALGFREADFHRLDDSEKGTVDQVPQRAVLSGAGRPVAAARARLHIFTCSSATREYMRPSPLPHGDFQNRKAAFVNEPFGGPLNCTIILTPRL